MTPLFLINKGGFSSKSPFIEKAEFSHIFDEWHPYMYVWWIAAFTLPLSSNDTAYNYWPEHQHSKSAVRFAIALIFPEIWGLKVLLWLLQKQSCLPSKFGRCHCLRLVVAGWEMTNVLPCPYNVVIALASGDAEGGSGWKLTRLKDCQCSPKLIQCCHCLG